LLLSRFLLEEECPSLFFVKLKEIGKWSSVSWDGSPPYPHALMSIPLFHFAWSIRKTWELFLSFSFPPPSSRLSFSPTPSRVKYGVFSTVFVWELYRPPTFQPCPLLVCLSPLVTSPRPRKFLRAEVLSFSGPQVSPSDHCLLVSNAVFSPPFTLRKHLYKGTS